MKTAFIGQRVRVIHSDTWPATIGREGTVISKPEECRPLAGPSAGLVWWGVMVDVDGLGAVLPTGEIFFPNLGYLEPILYEGHKPIETEQCIINPDGTYNPAGDVPLTVVNSEEELYV